MRRIVVLAPNWIGDAVMALPAIASVRHWQPSAHLAVAARKSVAPLFSMIDGVDAVVTLGGRGGWSDVWRMWRDAGALAAGSYDAALLLPNSLHVAILARRAGIPQRWGYRADLRSRLLTRAVPRPQGFVHHAEYYLQLVRGLGALRASMVAALRVTDEDRQRAVELLQGQGWQGATLVGFAPGAAFGLAKRWPPDRMAATAAALARADEGNAGAGRYTRRPIRHARRRADVQARSRRGGPDRRSRRSNRPSHARRAVCHVRGCRVERFRCDAPCCGIRRPGDRNLRSDQRAAHLAAAASIWGGHGNRRRSGLVPTMRVARLPARSPLHDQHRRPDRHRGHRTQRRPVAQVSRRPRMKPAVFLDRDGTLIEERGYLGKLEDIVLLAGTPAALRLLQGRRLCPGAGDEPGRRGARILR